MIKSKKLINSVFKCITITTTVTNIKITVPIIEGNGIMQNKKIFSNPVLINKK